MGIDPSHMDLQHLANDHYTTSPTGESSYLCMVWYGMVWYGMVWYGMVWSLHYKNY